MHRRRPDGRPPPTGWSSSYFLLRRPISGPPWKLPPSPPSGDFGSRNKYPGSAGRRRREKALSNERQFPPYRRSEERRVGEEGRSRWAPYHLKKKKRAK